LVWHGKTHQVLIDALGAWLAIGSDQGTRFWSLPTLKPIGRIGQKTAPGLAWDEANSRLMIGDLAGVFELPVQTEHEGLVTLGPATQLLTSSVNEFG
jgi:hypothetical protein